MSRSKWKGFYINNSLLKKKKKKIKIWSRNSTIPYSFIGKYVYIHNGRFFKKIFISREKVGYKFGSFFFTRILKKIIINKKGSKKSNSKSLVKTNISKKK